MTNNIKRFVVWICSKFNRQEIEQIILELNNILSNKNSDIKPKSDIDEQYPNYRKFSVDPNPPKTADPKSTLKKKIISN